MIKDSYLQEEMIDDEIIGAPDADLQRSKHAENQRSERVAYKCKKHTRNRLTKSQNEELVDEDVKQIEESEAL